MSNIQQELKIPAIKITQPIGDFFICSIPAQKLSDITVVDVRRLKDDDSAEYIGIQRTLSTNRVKELKQFVTTKDATFPTSIILSIAAPNIEWDELNKQIILREYIDSEDSLNNIPFDQIGKIIDGQHRVAGLEGYSGPDFDLSVTIFVDIDMAEQAHLFSIVNLAQTKVNKSLVYDLFEYSKSRSPQKACHNIAVALDETENSPFYQRIKRLGVATDGRFTETITQATFVQYLIKYISSDPSKDRDLLMRGKKLDLANQNELEHKFFRNLFIQNKEIEITKIIWTYFEAIKEKWPAAWTRDPYEKGFMLNKTNGFKALMKFLKPAYLSIATNAGELVSKQQFLNIFNKIDLNDDDFNIETFKPGSSGESTLYRVLKEKSGLG